MSASCKEIIDVDLEDSETRLVIQGDISEGQFSKIQLSLTSGYFEEVSPEFVDNAIVKITNIQFNQSETLSYTGNGFYQGQFVMGEKYKTYRLSVEYKGVTYETESTLFPAAKIDSIFFTSRIGGGLFSDSSFITTSLEIESTNTNAFYSIEFESINDSISPLEYNLSQAVDSARIFLFINPKVLLRQGDSLCISVKSIDRNNYYYLAALNNLGDNNQRGSATPHNPISNFIPEALGYFSAYSQITKDTVVEL